MILSIILFIFGINCESFRDTRFRDDFGIFWNVFRIFDINPGIRGFNIFIFRVRENIFSFLISFPFSFSLFPLTSSTSHKPKISYLHLTTFHTLPSISTTYFLHLIISMACFDWPKRTPHPYHGKLWLAKGDTSPPLFYTKPPLNYNITSPLQNQILYKLSFTLLFLFLLHFYKEKPS